MSETTTIGDDAQLLDATAGAVARAGADLMTRRVDRPMFRTRDEVVAAIEANDAATLATLRPALQDLRPQAQWAEDELEDNELPPGEWWVVDPVEGNINHIHGLPEWGVTATLIRDNVPVLTAVAIPESGDVYTARQGGGASCNGRPLQVTTKTDLDAAIVGTGQASPREGADTFRIIGASGTAMLTGSLVLRVSVPATLQLIHLAAGRMDVFWQFSGVRSGLVAGGLLVAEAGGTVTDAAGRPWHVGSTSFLATNPALHPAATAILAPLDMDPNPQNAAELDAPADRS